MLVHAHITKMKKREGIRIIAEELICCFLASKLIKKKRFFSRIKNIILIYFPISNSRENSHEIKFIKGIFIPQVGILLALFYV